MRTRAPVDAAPISISRTCKYLWTGERERERERESASEQAASKGVRGRRREHCDTASGPRAATWTRVTCSLTRARIMGVLLNSFSVVSDVSLATLLSTKHMLCLKNFVVQLILAAARNHIHLGSVISYEVNCSMSNICSLCTLL